MYRKLFLLFLATTFSRPICLINAVGKSSFSTRSKIKKRKSNEKEINAALVCLGIGITGLCIYYAVPKGHANRDSETVMTRRNEQYPARLQKNEEPNQPNQPESGSAPIEIGTTAPPQENKETNQPNQPKPDSTENLPHPLQWTKFTDGSMLPQPEQKPNTTEKKDPKKFSNLRERDLSSFKKMKLPPPGNVITEIFYTLLLPLLYENRLVSKGPFKTADAEEAFLRNNNKSSRGVGQLRSRVVKYLTSQRGLWAEVSAYKSKNGEMVTLRRFDDVISKEISPDGNYLFIKYKNYTGLLINLKEGTWLFISQQMDRVEFSPDGKYLAIQYSNGRGNLINLQKNCYQQEFEQVNDFTFSPDGNTLYLEYTTGKDVLTDKGVLINLQKMKYGELFDLFSPFLRSRNITEEVECEFSANGAYAVIRYSKYDDRKRILINLQTMESEDAEYVEFSSNGTHAFIRYKDKQPVLMNLQTRESKCLSTGIFSTNGAYAFIKDKNKNGELIKLETMAVLKTFEDVDKYIFSMDEDFLLIKRANKDCCIFNLKTKQSGKPFKPLEHFTACKASPNGTHLLIWNADKKYQLVDSETNKTKKFESVRSRVFLPDRAHLFIKYHNGNGDLINLQTMESVLEFRGWFYSDYSSNGKFYFIKYADNTGHLINLETMRVKENFTDVVDFEFSSNGKFYFIKYGNETGQLINLETMIVEKKFMEVKWLKFSSKGGFLFAEQKGGKLRVIDLRGNETKEHPLEGKFAEFFDEGNYLTFFDASGKERLINLQTMQHLRSFDLIKNPEFLPTKRHLILRGGEYRYYLLGRHSLTEVKEKEPSQKGMDSRTPNPTLYAPSGKFKLDKSIFSKIDNLPKTDKKGKQYALTLTSMIADLFVGNGAYVKENIDGLPRTFLSSEMRQTVLQHEVRMALSENGVHSLPETTEEIIKNYGAPLPGSLTLPDLSNLDLSKPED